MKIYKVEYIDHRTFKHKITSVLAANRSDAAHWIKRNGATIIDVWEA